VRLVDLDELLAASDGVSLHVPLAAAALDVLSVEPPAADNPLLALDNIIVIPHVGSDTRGTFVSVYECAVESISAFVDGRMPPHLANPEALDRR